MLPLYFEIQYIRFYLSLTELDKKRSSFTVKNTAVKHNKNGSNIISIVSVPVRCIISVKNFEKKSYIFNNFYFEVDNQFQLT